MPPSAQAPFQIAVIGEFSRGKSTLISRLVPAVPLPTGMTPTTQKLTRIRYGGSPHISIQLPEQAPAQYPLSADSLEELNEHEVQGDGMAKVDVVCSEPWLSSGVVIYDMPGMNEAGVNRIDLARETAEISDLILLCLNATSPFGMSEQELLEDIGLVGEQKLLVSLNFLDQVEEGQQVAVCKLTAEKVKAVVPEAIVGSLHAVADGGLDFDSVDSLKAIIESAAKDGSGDGLRKSLVAKRWELFSKNVDLELEQQHALLQQNADQRERELEALRSSLRDSGNRWQEMRDQFCEREDNALVSFRESVDEFTSDLLEKLKIELNSRPNPGKWLKDELGYRLKVETKNFTKIFERELAKELGR
ncbi:MAG: dynamin family protein, partial [Verrucomicrobiota bacterium]